MRDELYHWGTKGKAKEKHKYFAKIEKNNKTRYFYSKSEWLAYLRNKGNTVENKIDTAKKNLAELPSKFVSGNRIKTDTSSNITKQVENGKKYLDNRLDESMNFVLILPTKTVKKAWEFVKDAFDKDNTKDTKTKDSTPVPTINPATFIPANDSDVSDANKKEKVPEWAEGLNPITEEFSHDENQEAVNPNYDPYNLEYSNNCAYCTAAYDLRERGYDVEAMPYDPVTYDSTPYDIASWYENTDIMDWNITACQWVSDPAIDSNVSNKSTMWNHTESEFSSMPDKSRGQFGVYWTEGGGHSMVWEKENGKVTIRDCQTNDKYSYREFVDAYGEYVDCTMVLRTDNRIPSKNILKTVRNKE